MISLEYFFITSGSNKLSLSSEFVLIDTLFCLHLGRTAEGSDRLQIFHSIHCQTFRFCDKGL